MIEHLSLVLLKLHCCRWSFVPVDGHPATSSMPSQPKWTSRSTKHAAPLAPGPHQGKQQRAHGGDEGPPPAHSSARQQLRRRRSRQEGGGWQIMA